MKELKIVNDFYLLLKWYGDILSRFPRNHRYALGLRVENTLYDIMELLIEQSDRDKKAVILDKVSVKLDYLRFLVRLTFDLKLITMTQHHAFIEQIDNIGKQLGGWIKSISYK
ncbi:diversity-generating retroelement protein Avd [Candidatus Poribacteria bacterium]|nr:diversity-generating retroelement protein Avd [Candidatus Poribacteria bacterium]